MADRTFNKDDKLSNVHRHYYRFASKQVKKDEYISLRTSNGDHEFDKTNNGDPMHGFYWGSKAPIWNDANTNRRTIEGFDCRV